MSKTPEEIEQENKDLREQIALKENESLKAKMAELNKPTTIVEETISSKGEEFGNEEKMVTDAIAYLDAKDVKT